MSDEEFTGPPPRPEEVVDKWLKTTYLRYETKQDIAQLKKTLAVSIDEFLEIVRTSGPRCWLLDDGINMSLSLLTDVTKQTNCFVLPIWDANNLCMIGSGVREPDASDHVLRESLQPGGKRWIIVPCNDGMLPKKADAGKGDKTKNAYNEPRTGPSTPKDATDKPVDLAEGEPKEEDTKEGVPKGASASGQSEETGSDNNASADASNMNKKGSSKKKDDQKSEEEEDTEKTDPVLKYGGLHWGLMIIDTETEVARWLDGLVTVDYKTKERKRVAYISHMLDAGRAAGKILCGYDRLLGRECGKFTATTLKWVPHQGGDNITTNDAGSCGPHMFACLDHIYRNPRALEDLYAHFKRQDGGSRNFRRGGRGFNSRATRQQMQDMIRREQESTKAEDKLPLGLTRQIMKTLGLDITVQELMAAVHSIRGIGNAGAGKPKKHSGDNPADEPYRGRFMEALANNTLPENVSTLAQFRSYIQRLKLEEKKFSKTKGDTATTKIVIDGITYLIPNSDTRVWKSPPIPKTGVPKDTTEWPDFAHLDNRTLARWLGLVTNRTISEGFEMNTPKHSHTTSKAMLQRKYKQTFISEPDADFRDEWIFDTTVFNAGQDQDDLPASKIRYMIMQHYEPETIKYIQKYKYKKRPSDDGQGGSDPKKAKKEKSIWVTCSDEVLEKSLDEAIMNDPRAKSKDRMIYRALLFVKDGNKFADEDDATCVDFWINVPGVFKEGRDYQVDKNGQRQCIRGVEHVKGVMRSSFETADPDKGVDELPPSA
jgi:hypothetical protein